VTDRFVIRPAEHTFLAQARGIVRVYGRAADWRGVPVADRRASREHVAWHLAAIMRRASTARSEVLYYVSVWDRADLVAQHAAPTDTAALAMRVVRRWVEAMGMHPMHDSVVYEHDLV